MDSSGSQLIPGARPGEILAGKYRIERVLGAGGMGVVVAAYHLALDEHVAIKFLRPQAVANPEALTRFDREARAAVKIKSEHVARVTDVGRLDDGTPYMVMEYLDGIDLGRWLRERGAMPVEQAVELVLQACEALADAHALGIIHRDLKPSNLFCVQRSDGLLAVKILDFGISKLTGPGVSRTELDVTRAHTVIGSPFYMSPEQMMSSKDVDARTDIWSLGVILFELVSNHMPFEADEMPALVMKIMGTSPVRLCKAQPQAPLALEAIVTRCLEKDREARFANVAELATALRPLAPARALASVDRVVRVVRTAGLDREPERPSSVVAPAGGQATAAPQIAATPGRTPAGTLMSAGASAGASSLGTAETEPIPTPRMPAVLATQASWAQASGRTSGTVSRRRTVPVVVGAALMSAALAAAALTLLVMTDRRHDVSSITMASSRASAAPLPSSSPLPSPMASAEQAPDVASPAASAATTAATTASASVVPPYTRQTRPAVPLQHPPATRPNVYDHM